MAQRTYKNNVASDHARQHNGNVYGNIVIGSARAHFGDHYGDVYHISEHTEYASQANLGLDFGTRPRNLKSFRIAIICALIQEFNAVDILLEEIWEGEEFRPKYPDQNTYRFGRLGGKPVALVNLPGMGKVPAATVAAHLHISLPNIEIAFLVGICGGAPQDEKHTPIELGDVIVGTQVIQTDFGRLQDTGLERKSEVEDVLGRLPPKIRQRLAFLESWRSRKAILNDMTATIESKLRDPEFTDMFAPPQHQQSGNRALSKTPKIFFGRMASSDVVIRSEAHRDDLIMKQRILGFEMEGAGTWDQLSTVLVKSVCDYANSQKSKEWQPYAALSAAACARAVISRWLFPRSEDEVFTENGQDRDDPRGQGQPRQKQTLPKRRVVNLPSFPMKFVERTAPLDFLRDSLVPGQDHARAALVGLGGMGKSRVAARFAQDFQDAHPDTHVLWVNSSDPYHFDEDFKKITRSLRIPGFENPSVDYIALIKSWLRSPDSGKWLIILDNADNRDFIFQTSNSSGFRFAVTDCIPDKEECCVLMTSRDSFAATSFVGWGKGNIFELLKMTDVEACRLLCAGKSPSEHRRGSEIEGKQIVSRLDCIPLAIVQASAYIFKKGTMTFRKYLRKLEQEEESLLSKKDLEVPIPVLVTWGVSLQQIESTSTYAIELLSVMSFLDKGRIPAWILKAHQDDDNFDDAIDTLSTFSFIDVNRSEDSEISINMHHLVQVATRMWLRTKGHEISAFQNSLSCLAQHYPAATFQNWPSCHLLEPHVDSLEAFLQTRGEVISNQAREDRAELLYNSICYKRETGLYQEAFRLAQSILPEVNKLYGERSENSHAVKHTMVVLKLDQGSLTEAAEDGEKLLLEQRNTFGSNSQHTLLTMRTLAMAYLQQDKLSEAEERCSAVVKVRIPDLDKIDTADSHALDALTTLAEIHEARATRQTLHIRKALFQSGQHSHTAPAILGALQTLSPTTDRAEDLHSRILDVRRRTEAEDDPHIIDSEQDLAVTYNRQGRFQEAQTLLDHVIATRRTWLGSEHAKLIISLHNSAWSKWGTGQCTEALELEERILSQSMGAELRDVQAISLYQRTIMGLLWSLGHYRALEKEAKKAVDEHITWFTTIDERTLCCMAVLAEAHERCDKLDLALTVRDQAMEHLCSALSLQIMDEPLCMALLAEIVREHGFVPIGQKLASNALSKMRKVEGRKVYRRIEEVLVKFLQESSKHPSVQKINDQAQGQVTIPMEDLQATFGAAEVS